MFKNVLKHINIYIMTIKSNNNLILKALYQENSLAKST